MANHASHGQLPYPLFGFRYSVDVPYLDATGTPIDPTALDTQISKDNGVFTACTEEVTLASGAKGGGMITFTLDEMSCELAKVWFGCATAKPTMMTFSPRRLPPLYGGVATAGSSVSITVPTSVPRGFNLWRGCFVGITSGTGIGQARIVYASDKLGVLSVFPDWEVTPDNTSNYMILQSEYWFPQPLALGAAGIIVFHCQTGSTSTSIITDLIEVTNDHYNTKEIHFITGVLAGQRTAILDYDGASKTYTVTATVTGESPASGDIAVAL